jgi:hypothetical protein
VPGEIGHLDAVEDRQLDGLLRTGGQLGAGLVELLDEVDRRQVRAAQLGEPPAQREPGPDPPDEPGVGERPADVRNRRLRQAEPAGELAGPGRDAAVLGEQVEDRGRPRHRRGERVGLEEGAVAGRSVGAHCVVHASWVPTAPVITTPFRANMLNRVPYLDSAYPAAHTVQPTAICSICWTVAGIT